MSLNIVDEIFKRHSGESIAVIDGGGEYSYASLKQEVERLSSMLPNLSGKRVGLHIPNGIAHIFWSLAILRNGGTLVPVPSELTEVERKYLVATTHLHYLLTAGPSSWHAGSSNIKQLLTQDSPAAADWVELSEALPPPWDEATLQALNPALIRFSSGTTGKAKGVILSHETLLDRVTACNEGLKIGEEDRIIWILPMAHHFAVSIVLYLIHGATTVIENFHMGESLFKTLEKHKGTVLYGSPYHYALLAGYAEGKKVGSLRLAVSTASALNEATARAFRERYGIPLTQGMGIIEIGLPLLNLESSETCPESVGKPQSSFSCQIIRDDHTEALPDEIGSLWIQGKGMFDAYLAPWQTRDQLVNSDNYFPTGDLATKDAAGNLYLVGRTKSVINVGGMKSFPEETEAVLLQHPQVQEVRVYGEAHSSFGQVPAAEIVPMDEKNPPKASSLMTFCRSQLASYKIPVKYKLVSSISKTASGKILRNQETQLHPNV